MNLPIEAPKREAHAKEIGDIIVKRELEQLRLAFSTGKQMKSPANKVIMKGMLRK